MLPGKPGTRARRHTLILIRSFWRVTTDYKVTDQVGAPTIDICVGALQQRGVAQRTKEIFCA